MLLRRGDSVKVSASEKSVCSTGNAYCINSCPNNASRNLDPAVIPSCVRCTKRSQTSRVHIVSCVLPRVFDLGKTVSPQELKLPYHHYQSQTYMHNPCSSCFSFCSSAVAVVSAFGDDRRSSGRVSVVLDLRCDLRGGAGGAGTFGCPGGG